MFPVQAIATPIRDEPVTVPKPIMLGVPVRALRYLL